MTRNRPARLGGGLFVISGLLTLVNNYMPASGNLDIGLMNLVGLLAIVVGLASWFVIPWGSMPSWTTLSLPIVALGLIGIANAEGGVSGQTFSAFFLLLSAYIGATQPRWTTLWFSPLMTVIYVLAALHRTDFNDAAVWSVSVVIPVGVLVGETIAGALASSARLQLQSDRRAELLAVAARSARSVSVVDENGVLKAVADAAVALGYEAVAVEVFDNVEGTYRCVESRGLPPEFTDSVHEADTGLTGEVRRRHAQVVFANYSDDKRSMPLLTKYGFHVVIGTPIWMGSRMIAVLNVGTRAQVEVEPAELEALVLLADQAGHGLDLAELFDRERKETQRYRRESLIDPLSGLGSRRHADEIIDTVRAGDALVLIDLDDFKSVNDEQGHAAGDLVIAALGGFLRVTLRAGDDAARFGGDEFVLALRRPGLELVEAVERIRLGWQRTDPAATLSAGTAILRRGESPRDALDRADVALLNAKAAGRNTAHHADLVSEAKDASAPIRID